MLDEQEREKRKTHTHTHTHTHMHTHTHYMCIYIKGVDDIFLDIMFDKFIHDVWQ